MTCTLEQRCSYRKNDVKEARSWITCYELKVRPSHFDDVSTVVSSESVPFQHPQATVISIISPSCFLESEFFNARRTSCAGNTVTHSATPPPGIPGSSRQQIFCSLHFFSPFLVTICEVVNVKKQSGQPPGTQAAAKCRPPRPSRRISAPPIRLSAFKA